MARFPVDKSKLPEIGKALARAVTDAGARNAYKDDPNAYLIAAGVDPGAIANLTFDVVEDGKTNLKLVIPSAVDEGKVASGDVDYLTELGASVTLACTF